MQVCAGKLQANVASDFGLKLMNVVTRFIIAIRSHCSFRETTFYIAW